MTCSPTLKFSMHVSFVHYHAFYLWSLWCFCNVSWLIVGFKFCWSCLLRDKDIVFRFIIEYINLMDFGVYVISLFLYEDLKTIF
jgi:hypothetical protein